jgi:hypothetical protein
LFSRLGKWGAFRPPKGRESSHSNLCPFEMWVSRLDKSRVFRPPKCRNWDHGNLGPLELMFSRTGKSRFYRAQNTGNSSHEAMSPWTVDFTISIIRDLWPTTFRKLPQRNLVPLKCGF